MTMHGFDRARAWARAGVFLLAALAALPAARAESTGSGSFVGSIDGKPQTITFKDAYAFRAESPQKEVVTIVILSEAPLDTKAMTAALKKDRRALAIDDFIYKLAYARIDVDGKGRVAYSVLSVPGKSVGINPNQSEVRVNSAKRIEGTASESWSGGMLAGKLEMRYAVDLADLGPPLRR